MPINPRSPKFPIAKVSCFTVTWAGLLESPFLCIMQRFDCYSISPYYFQRGPTVCRPQSVQLVFSFTTNPQWKLTLHRNELIKHTVNPKSPFNSVTALPKSVFISILFSWKWMQIHWNDLILWLINQVLKALWWQWTKYYRRPLRWFLRG